MSDQSAERTMKCDTCGGSGMDLICDEACQPCQDCNGSGIQPEQTEYKKIRDIFEKECSEFQYYKSVCSWSEEYQTYLGVNSRGIMHTPLNMLTGYIDAYKSSKQEIDGLQADIVKTIIEKDKQIESMKCCENCHDVDRACLSDPCDNCSRNEFSEEAKVSDKWKQK